MSFTYSIGAGSTMASGFYDYRVLGGGVSRNATDWYYQRLILQAVFNDVYTHFVATERLAPHDKMMVTMLHEPTGHTRSTPLIFVQEWDTLAFLDMMEGSIQSNDEIDPANTLFRFIYVRGSRAGRYFTASADVETFIRSKQCIIRVDNADHLCFYHCVALAMAFGTDDYPDMKRSSATRRKEVKRLHALTAREEQTVSLLDIPTLADVFELHIVVVSSDGLEIVVNAGKAYEKHCVLFYVPATEGVCGHFHFVKTDGAGALWNRNKFCYLCLHAYIRGPHICRGACLGCGGTECVGREHRLSEFGLTCEYCNLSVWDDECLVRHQKNYICEKGQRCGTCHLYFPVMKAFKDHTCGMRKCNQCKAQVPYEEEHLCFVQPAVEDATDAQGMFIFYDYETYVHKDRHCVALVVAMYGHSDVVYAFKTNVEFCTWLFSKKHKGYTCIAHNGGKYDMHFIKREMIRMELKSHDICSGSSIFYMATKRFGMRFLDAFKFIPMALRNFPKTFGITETCKGYFPYRFLTQETLQYTGPYPGLEYYDFDHLKPDDHKEALVWYNEHCHEVFDMESIILDYCMSDVKLLKQGCLLYRDLFLRVTERQVDPFDQVTIASTCLKIYRTMDMPHNSIGKLASESDAIEERNWLVYYLSTHYTYDELNDDHAITETGERLAVSYKVGYEPSNLHVSAVLGPKAMPQQCTALLFLDCMNSGCMLCHRRHTIHPTFLISMRELFLQVEYAVQQLQMLFKTVVVMRGCEWIKTKKFLKWTTDRPTAPLRMRDAFFGGRTEPIKLFKRVEGEERLGYVDFTSLYPSVQSGLYRNVLTGLTHEIRYPIGHPERIVNPLPNPSLYFGFMKARVWVPEDQYHAVLPVRKDGKLLFPVGRFTGTWTTLELEVALQQGARIEKVFDVLHFKESSTQLFASYVARFMKIKIESGGWGKTGIDGSDPRAVDDFLKTNAELWGIKIDPDAMAPNPGLYYIAKLCLNSLWGKFAQRPDLGQCHDTFSDKDFVNLCFDPKHTVTSIFFHDNAARTVKFKVRTAEEEDVSNTNIAVAAFTTAHARLRLFELIRVVGKHCVYYDTDSLIYSYSPSAHGALPCGAFLGDLTNELGDDEYIVEFISTGPKSYAYITNLGKTCIKVKGFTLNVKNLEKINLEALRACVFDKERLAVSTMQFQISDDHSIRTLDMVRTLQFTSNKRSPVWDSLKDRQELDTIPLILS